MRTVLVASAFLLASLAYVGPGAASVDTVHVVTATNFEWTPNDLSVDVDDSVQFTNSDGTHTWELSDGSQSCTLPCTKTFATEGVVEYRCGVHSSMTGIVRVGATPEVVITIPSPGAGATGVIHVEGLATHVTSSIQSVSIAIADAPAVAATIIGSGTSVSWSADVPTANVMDGERLLVATASTTAGVTGQASVSIMVENPTSLDLAVTSVTAASAASTSSAIGFQVANLGNEHAGAVTVIAEYLYDGTWRAIGSATLAAVEYRATESGSITWTTGASPHIGSFTIRVTVDPSGALPDPDRSNNARTASAGWFTSAVPGIILTEAV